MLIFKSKTIEGYIISWLSLISICFLALLFAFLWVLKIKFLYVTLIIIFTTLFWVRFIVIFRSKLVSSFSRALLHLEAVGMEDYKQYAKPLFTRGIVGKFHNQLKDFSEELSNKKLRYDQHVFLVYQLIDQLDTPVLVFNQKNQLTYANGAFSVLYAQPWQRYRHASTKLLGLVKKEDGWHLENTDHQIEQQWQISQSTFIDTGVAHQLLVFTNIGSLLRSNRLKAWQQLINVMGHEIRNSLTPVSTIAESLSERADSQRDKEALALISERCRHLQDFLNRYASISRQIKLNCEKISVLEFANRVTGLFYNIEFNVEINAEWVWADKTLLEQVLINLIKNSQEAEANRLTLKFSEEDNKTNIKLIDDGHGFANVENLFVPLYSTKQEGQGIGLSFCRNIIEQHRGTIKLANNRSQGVSVTISLPS